MKKYSFLKRILSIVSAMAVTVSFVEQAIPSVSAENVERKLPTGGVYTYTATEIDEKTAESYKYLEYKTRPNTLYLSENDGSSDYAYNSLDDTEKAAYELMNEKVKAFTESNDFKTEQLDSSYVISVECKNTTSKQIYKAFLALLYDYPQYFWTGNGCSYRPSGADCTIYISPSSYYYDPTTRVNAQKAIDETAKSWCDKLSEVSGDYEKIMLLHDLIIDKIDYTFDKNGNASGEAWAHNIEGVLSGKGAVCESYARTFQYVLNLVGIENIYIVGDAGEAHAWNAVKLDDGYYPVDTTWDDFNKDDYGAKGYYDYFCIQGSVFGKNHTAYTQQSSMWLYDIPEFSESTDYIYYYKYNSYASANLTSSDMEDFISNAQSSGKGDYVYYVTASQSVMRSLFGVLKPSATSYLQSTYGYLFVAENIKIEKPATSISLDKSSAEIEIDGEVALTATLSEDSDDRIIWTTSNSRIASISGSGTKVTIKGLRDGKATITATARKGGMSQTCEITVGTGEYQENDYTIWAGGNKLNKSVTLTPTISATSWTDAKGKTKNGKIVWITANEDIDIAFNSDKHTVTTKAVKTIASVSSKGVVTAKSAGTVYVYACDTGSLKTEKYVVEVKQSATKLTLSGKAGSTDKADVVKKLNIAVGDTSDKIYIVPYVKNGSVSGDAAYTAVTAKPAQSNFVSVSDIQTDSDGNKYFTVTAKAVDTSKTAPKAGKATVTVQNTESGKKINLTVTVISPVTAVSASGTGSLAKKKDTVNLTLSVTAKQSNSVTTDKAKVYVSVGEATVSGTKVTIGKGAVIKAKLKNNEITLTASKDASSAAIIYIAYTDSVNKKTVLYKLADVDSSGKITLTGSTESSEESET